LGVCICGGCRALYVYVVSVFVCLSDCLLVWLCVRVFVCLRSCARLCVLLPCCSSYSFILGGPKGPIWAPRIPRGGQRAPREPVTQKAVGQIVSNIGRGAYHMLQDKSSPASVLMFVPCYGTNRFQYWYCCLSHVMGYVYVFSFDHIDTLAQSITCSCRFSSATWGCFSAGGPSSSQAALSIAAV
jgi:hypothetical protein